MELRKLKSGEKIVSYWDALDGFKKYNERFALMDIQGVAHKIKDLIDNCDRYGDQRVCFVTGSGIAFIKAGCIRMFENSIGAHCIAYDLEFVFGEWDDNGNFSYFDGE